MSRSSNPLIVLSVWLLGPHSHGCPLARVKSRRVISSTFALMAQEEHRLRADPTAAGGPKMGFRLQTCRSKMDRFGLSSIGVQRLL